MCVIGVRLGASLAAMVTVEMPVDFLVLWNPCVRMKSYLRELQAIALTAQRASNDIAGGLESAGFAMSGETMTHLRGIDLLDFGFNVIGKGKKEEGGERKAHASQYMGEVEGPPGLQQ